MTELAIHIQRFTPLSNEAELMKLAAEGDREAYGKLYSHYYPYLHKSISFICKNEADAQETIHEAFFRIWAKKEMLAMIRSFSDYAYVITKNILFTSLRRNKTREKVYRNIADSKIPYEENLADQQLVFEQYHKAAVAAISKLSDQKRQAFLLRTQEDLTIEEIAQHMGIAASTVKKHLYSAIETVKRELRSHGDWLILIAFYFLS